MTARDIPLAGRAAARAASRPALFGVLRALFANARLLFPMLRDFIRGRYRQVPVAVIGAAAFAALYLVSPVDFLPDFIPGLGFLDDAAVFALCLKLIETDLNRYREWRRSKVIDVEATRV